MSIGGIGGLPALSAQSVTQRVHSRMDEDGSGEVSLDEFSAAPAPANAPSAEEVFQSLDADENGGLSVEEMSELANQAGAAGMGGPPPGGGMGGPPPGGGMGGPPPGGGGGGTGGAEEATSVESSSPTVYEEADTNQDGEVSDAEQLAYDLAQLLEQQRAASTYEEVAQTGEEAEQSSTMAVQV